MASHSRAASTLGRVDYPKIPKQRSITVQLAVGSQPIAVQQRRHCPPLTVLLHEV